MKSPFAQEQVNTYTYPAPWNPNKPQDKIKIDDEALADPKPPWIKVRVPNSKGLNDAIGDFTQQVVTTVGVQADSNGGARVTETSIESRIARANQGVFALLVEAWSFSDEPTPDEYRRLELWAGTWVDACMTRAMAEGQGPITVGKDEVDTTSEPSSGRPGRARVKPSA
jgi:hypothetical protein